VRRFCRWTLCGGTQAELWSYYIASDQLGGGSGQMLGADVFTTMVLPLLAYEAIALSAASPPVQPAATITRHLGLILWQVGCCLWGCSSPPSQTVQFWLLSHVCPDFVFWWVDAITKSLGGPVVKLWVICVLKHYNNLVQGIFDTSSLILFASYIVLGIFLTAQSIDALRFQRS